MTRRAVRLLAIGTTTFLVVVGAAVGIAVSTRSVPLLPTGAQSVTLTIDPNGPSTFSGSIAGVPISGKGTSSTSPSPNNVPGFTITGSYGSLRFVIHATLTEHQTGTSMTLGFKVTGTVGDTRVTGTLQFVPASLLTNVLQLSVNGHIGSEHLTGTAQASESSGAISATLAIR